jgi:tRNA pseudouridine32 synthase
VVFRAKGALVPKHAPIPLPKSNRRKRGGPAQFVHLETSEGVGQQNGATVDSPAEAPQLSTEEALAKITRMSSADMATASDAEVATKQDQTTQTESLLYCRDCYLPLHPDPKPEKLYIFLHALRYTTSLGRFETDMPEWAKEGWIWDRS